MNTYTITVKPESDAFAAIQRSLPRLGCAGVNPVSPEEIIEGV